MTKLSCGQSLAALPTSLTSTKARRCGKLLFDRGREESFVHADVLDAGLDAHFVGAIGGFFVVHAPGMAGEFLVGVVADGVALDGVGLEGQARDRDRRASRACRA